MSVAFCAATLLPFALLLAYMPILAAVSSPYSALKAPTMIFSIFVYGFYAWYSCLSFINLSSCVDKFFLTLAILAS